MQIRVGQGVGHHKVPFPCAAASAAQQGSMASSHACPWIGLHACVMNTNDADKEMTGNRKAPRQRPEIGGDLLIPFVPGTSCDLDTL